MCLVRCLTDKRHKLFGSNKCWGFFLLFFASFSEGVPHRFLSFCRRRRNTIYLLSLACAYTTLTLQPYFFSIYKKNCTCCSFFSYLVSPNFLSTSAHASLFAKTNLSLSLSVSHTSLDEQSFDFFFLFCFAFQLLLCLTLNLPLSKAPFESNSGLKRIHGFLGFCFV